MINGATDLNMGVELQKLYSQEKELRKQLQQQSEERVWFIRALVHELKSPLTSLLGSSSLLADSIKEEPWARLVKNINQSAEYLKKRVDELLTYARSETGVLSIKLGEVSPKELLKEIYSIKANDAYSKGQQLKLELSERLPIIKADADRLQEVIINLLDNAFKACSAGDVITLRCRKRDKNLEFSIQDTGCGIPDDKHALLFNPYYRMGCSDGDVSSCTSIGIGLSICKGIIELHKGQIWVESEEGKGSTFKFLIPTDLDDNQ